MAASLAKNCVRHIRLAAVAVSIFAAATFLLPYANAAAAEPIKVGFSMAMTGGVAQNGKQLLIALQLWRDDVNAKGGLLGRPVELVYYDDQSNPSNVPGIYTKLINVDKVDLILGPYATNMVAAAMPVIMENNKTTVTILGVGVNQHFNYGALFFDGAGRARRGEGFLQGLFRACRGSAAEAANGCDALGRCRVRQDLG